MAHTPRTARNAYGYGHMAQQQATGGGGGGGSGAQDLHLTSPQFQSAASLSTDALANTLYEALYSNAPVAGTWTGDVATPLPPTTASKSRLLPESSSSPRMPKLRLNTSQQAIGANGLPSPGARGAVTLPSAISPRSPASRRPASLLSNGEPQPMRSPRLRREISYLNESKGHGILARSPADLDFVLPPSAVPETNAVYARSPLPPSSEAAPSAQSSDEGDDITPKPLLWQNRVFPNRVPASRQDCVLLSHWLAQQSETLIGAHEAIEAISLKTKMVPPPESLHTRREVTPEEYQHDAERLGAQSVRLTSAAETAIRACRDAQTLYGRAAGEIIREVSVHCAERGALMANVWNGAMMIYSKLTQRLGDLVSMQGALTHDSVQILGREQSRILDERIQKALEVSALEAELEQRGTRRGSTMVTGGRRRRGSVAAEELLASLAQSGGMEENAGEENMKLRAALEDARTEMARMEVELERQIRNEESRQVLEQKIRHLEQDLASLREHQRSLTPRPDRYLGPHGQKLSTAMLDSLLRLATEAAPFLSKRKMNEEQLAKIMLSIPKKGEDGWAVDDMEFLGILRHAVDNPDVPLRRPDVTRALEREEMTVLIDHVSTEGLAFIQRALQREIDISSIVEFVTGSTPEGLALSPAYYGTMFGSDVTKQELTEIITYATVPTRRRFELMEKQIEVMHNQQSSAKNAESLQNQANVDDKEKKDDADDGSKKSRKKQSPLERFLSKQWKDTFVGMGTGSDVPKFMRTNGKIRNRNMSKRDTEKMVKEIWSDKMRHDAKQPRPTSLEEFTGIFLQKRMGIQSAVVEIGYNFIHALQKHAYDADCELFLKILQGEIREEVYSAQIKMCRNVSLLCEALDSLSHGDKVTGYVSLADLRVGLRSLFPKKSADRHAELMEALSEDQPGTQIEHGRLFEEDREFNQGPFAEALRDQWLEERLEHLERIEAELTKMYESRGDMLLDMINVSLALREADPEVPDGQRRKLAEDATRGGATTVAAVMRNLRQGAMDSADGDDESEDLARGSSGGGGKAGLFKAAAKLKLASAASGGASKLANLANFASKSANRTPKCVQNAVETVRETWIERETAVKTPRKKKSEKGDDGENSSSARATDETGEATAGADDGES
ncbi:translin-associated factor X-interacting 1 [Pycnococcus provasolii]